MKKLSRKPVKLKLKVLYSAIRKMRKKGQRTDFPGDYLVRKYLDNA